MAVHVNGAQRVVQRAKNRTVRLACVCGSSYSKSAVQRDGNSLGGGARCCHKPVRCADAITPK
eukprot:3815367-Prymnesium_polylepis.1